jgi:hypothetical protein
MEGLMPPADGLGRISATLSGGLNMTGYQPGSGSEWNGVSFLRNLKLLPCICRCDARLVIPNANRVLVFLSIVIKALNRDAVPARASQALYRAS